jgi:hypothetical protein
MNRGSRRSGVLATAFAAVGLAAAPAVTQTGTMAGDPEMKQMMDISGGMDMSAIPRVPPVFGYADDEVRIPTAGSS